MDGERFDDLARAVARTASRRGVLRGLAAGLGAGLLARLDLRATAADDDGDDDDGDDDDCRRANRSCRRDGQCCDGLVCGPGGTCRAGCKVDGVFYAPDAPNPANPCQSCQPRRRTRAFLNRPGGAACSTGDPCRTGETCRSGVCGGGTVTACPPSACVDGRVARIGCDGAGGCAADGGRPCDPYGCDAAGVACRTACTGDGDCVGDAYCLNGACVADGGPGDPCATAAQCRAGLSCADGVCCDTACAGQCEVCNLPGSAGTCVAVTGAPVGGRPACPGDECNDGVCQDGACALAPKAAGTRCDPEPCGPGGTSTCLRGVCNGGACCDGGPFLDYSPEPDRSIPCDPARGGLCCADGLRCCEDECCADCFRESDIDPNSPADYRYFCCPPEQLCPRGATGTGDCCEADETCLEFGDGRGECRNNGRFCEGQPCDGECCGPEGSRTCCPDGTYCSGGVCVPVPTGGCVANADCGSPALQCVGERKETNPTTGQVETVPGSCCPSGRSCAIPGSDPGAEPQPDGPPVDYCASYGNRCGGPGGDCSAQTYFDVCGGSCVCSPRGARIRF